jgi:hypothetical protein
MFEKACTLDQITIISMNRVLFSLQSVQMAIKPLSHLRVLKFDFLLCYDGTCKASEQNWINLDAFAPYGQIPLLK